MVRYNDVSRYYYRLHLRMRTFFFCFRLQKIFDFIKRDFIPLSLCVCVMKTKTVCYFDRLILNFQLHIQIKMESQL